MIAARFEYVTGCVRYLLEGPDSDGDPAEHVIDEQRLVEVKSGKRVEQDGKAGGPRDMPRRAATG